MLRQEYPKLGSVFTLNLLNKNITFLIGPEVSAHFFKASESDLSQQFFTEALGLISLKGMWI
ncbi:putative sterol 14-alpha-demethylase [Helianthus anomalus]